MERHPRDPEEDFLSKTVTQVTVTAGVLAWAYLGGQVLLDLNGNENNISLLFVLAVALVSRFTDGYRYGIIASVVGTFCINYFFLFPYSTFTLSISGYTVAFISMLSVSLMIGTLVTQSKVNMQQAIQREQHTRELWHINEELTHERLQAQNAAEKEKVRADLLRAISHDLRTPLTLIWGESAALLEEKNLDKYQREMIGQIVDNAHWLICMVENILSLTRLSTQASLQTRNELVEELVSEALVKVKRHFPDFPIGVRVPDQPLMVRVDALLIEQVIINLLENAIRHSGDREHVELVVTLQDKEVLFAVRDQGKGLPSELLNRLQQDKELAPENAQDLTRGVGIGLSVCRSILLLHGGRLDALNLAQGGAELCFILPLPDEEENLNEAEYSDH